MRVRQFELRLLAVALTLFWALGALVVLATFHPGGPIDFLVGVAASLPVPLAVCAIVWPPLVRSNRGFAGIMWLGLLAGLLLIPSIWSLTHQIVSGQTTSLLPSAEVVYPFVLALFATSLFAGIGISRQLIPEVGIGRRRIAASGAFAVAATLGIGLVFAGVSLADTSTLAFKPVPPPCSGTILEATAARVDLDLWGDVDGRSIGTAGVAGVRSGSDVSWKGPVSRGPVFAEYGMVILGPDAWTLGRDGIWTRGPRSGLDGDLLDLAVLRQALSLPNRAAAEDHGFESVQGERARRCRIAVDGPTFLASFPEAAWLTGDANVKAWRGQLDYWLFEDGTLGRVEGFVNGASQNLLPHGLLATINVRMNATERGQPVSINPPGT